MGGRGAVAPPHQILRKLKYNFYGLKVMANNKCCIAVQKLYNQLSVNTLTVHRPPQ